jgi:hypothetical protein
MTSIHKIIRAAALIAAAIPAGAATLLHEYSLVNSLADNYGGPSLVSNGGVLSSAGYAFNANHGLSLSGGLLNTGDYSIALNFNFSILSGYRKILDFDNRQLDYGLYTLNSALTFYPITVTYQAVLSPSTPIELVFTRSAATHVITAYGNGISLFSAVDTVSPAVFTGSSGIIYFFTDDTAIPGNDPTGSVQRIRIYDGALTASQVATLDAPAVGAPEPAAFTLIGLSLAGLARLRHRRNS